MTKHLDARHTANGRISNAPGSCESISAGAPTRPAPHHSFQPRDERRKRLGRGHGAFEQRALDDSRRRRFEQDRHAIDRIGNRLRLELEHEQRPERACVANRRGQFQPPRHDLARDERERKLNRRRAPVGLLERHRQRVEQARKHERERLQRVDRPFQIHRRLEPRSIHVRDERPVVSAAGDAVQHEPAGPKRV